MSNLVFNFALRERVYEFAKEDNVGVSWETQYKAMVSNPQEFERQVVKTRAAYDHFRKFLIDWKWKTQPCHTGFQCSYGNHCHFAHSTVTLAAIHGDEYLAKICRKPICKNNAQWRSKCLFVHPGQPIRDLQTKKWSIYQEPLPQSADDEKNCDEFQPGAPTFNVEPGVPDSSIEAWCRSWEPSASIGTQLFVAKEKIPLAKKPDLSKEIERQRKVLRDQIFQISLNIALLKGSKCQIDGLLQMVPLFGAHPSVIYDLAFQSQRLRMEIEGLSQLEVRLIDEEYCLMGGH